MLCTIPCVFGQDLVYSGVTKTPKGQMVPISRAHRGGGSPHEVLPHPSLGRPVGVLWNMGQS